MKNFVASFLSTGIIQLSNLATRILAARLLLPEGRGELALLVLWPILIADLDSMGVNTAVAYRSARGDTEPREVFAATVWLSALLCPLPMAAYALAVLPVYGDQRPEIVAMAWIFVAMPAIHLYSLALISQFQGEQRFGTFNLLRTVAHLFYLVFILAMIATGGIGVTGFAWSFMTASAATGAVALVLAGKQGWIGLRARIETIRGLFVYGFRSHVGNVLAIANRRLDQLLISVTLAVSDLGLYVIAVTVAGIPMLITATTDLLAFPKMAAQQDDAGRQFVLGRYMRATLWLVVPAAAALIVVAPEFIRLLFGSAFLPAADIARILLLTSVAYVFRVLLSSYLRAADRMMIIARVEAIGVAVTAAALAVLVPLFGLTGAAVAQLIAYSVPVGVCIWMIARDHPFDFAEIMRFRTADFDVFREVAARYRDKGQADAE
jgi:O-antigen/teichoic acid export membrane protein